MPAMLSALLLTVAHLLAGLTAEAPSLEVLGDQKTLYPNMVETLSAAEALIKDGFEVMVYCSDDPIMAKRLEDIGCCAIMPLGSLIGSNQGLRMKTLIEVLIAEITEVPKGTVMSRIHRGRKALEKALLPYARQRGLTEVPS